MLPVIYSSAASDRFGQEQDTSSPVQALEVVIPFTTLQDAQRSVQDAEWLCSGLHASLRVIRVLAVPYPLDLDRPLISEAAAGAEMNRLRSDLPMRGEIWCCREWVAGFLSAIPARSLVILTCRTHWFFSAEKNLCRALKKSGHRVFALREGSSHV